MNRKTFLKSVGAASTVPLGSAFAKSNDVTVHFLKFNRVNNGGFPFFKPTENRGYTYDICDGLYIAGKGEKLKICRETGRCCLKEDEDLMDIYGSRLGHDYMRGEFREIKVLKDSAIKFELGNSSREDYEPALEEVMAEIKKRIELLVNANCREIYVERYMWDSCIYVGFHKDVARFCLANWFSIIGYTGHHEKPRLQTDKFTWTGYNRQEINTSHDKITNKEIEKTIYNYSQEKDYGILV
jgi:hypothetical protein